MRIVLILTFIAAACVLLMAASPTAPPTVPKAPKTAVATVDGASLVGKAAPDFTLADYEGKKHHLADYRSKVVVLEWFNPGCPIVNRYYDKPEWLEKAKAELSKKGVVWLSVCSSAKGKEGYGVDTYREWQKTHAKANPVLQDADGTVGRLYGAPCTPTIYVIGGDGKVAYYGAFDEAGGPKEAPKGALLVGNAVDSLLAGKPVAIAVTKPFGCGVKYPD